MRAWERSRFKLKVILAATLALTWLAVPTTGSWAGSPQSESSSAPSPTPNPSATGKIVGRVTADGKPVGHANVTVTGTRIVAGTDQDGRFLLEGVPPRRCELVVQSWLCDRQTREVVLSAGETVTVQIPIPCPCLNCPNESKATLTAACFMADPSERARLGQRCSVHPAFTLSADTVRIRYGLQLGTPEYAAGRDSFPNARLTWEGGCVPSRRVFAEVAYCSECRRAQARWVEKHRGSPLH